MSDIVERLRIWDDPGETICLEAAAQIERLQAALERISKLECGLLDPGAGIGMFTIARDIARDTLGKAG